MAAPLQFPISMPAAGPSSRVFFALRIIQIAGCLALAC